MRRVGSADTVVDRNDRDHWSDRRDWSSDRSDWSDRDDRRDQGDRDDRRDRNDRGDRGDRRDQGDRDDWGDWGATEPRPRAVRPPVRTAAGVATGPAAEEPSRTAPRRSRLPAPLALLRPRQWVKNVFVLVVPLAVDPAAVLHDAARAAAAVVAFTAASAAVYVLNDWLDREQDRLHPTKCRRPLACGRVRARGAVLLGAGCLAVLAACAAPLPPAVWGTIAGYAALNLAYCLALKHYPLVDVSVVAVGFVLRAVAGCLAVAAPIIPTLIICVYCACLLMSLGKRRHELASLRDRASAQRPALTGYSVPLLDQLMTVLLATTLISYELFVLSAPQPNAAVLAIVTVPFAAFALCRYLQLVAVHRSGGEPGRDVLTDLPLLVTAVMWLTCLGVGRLV